LHGEKLLKEDGLILWIIFWPLHFIFHLLLEMFSTRARVLFSTRNSKRNSTLISENFEGLVRQFGELNSELPLDFIARVYLVVRFSWAQRYFLEHIVGARVG